MPEHHTPENTDAANTAGPSQTHAKHSSDLRDEEEATCSSCIFEFSECFTPCLASGVFQELVENSPSLVPDGGHQTLASRGVFCNQQVASLLQQRKCVRTEAAPARGTWGGGRGRQWMQVPRPQLRAAGPIQASPPVTTGTPTLQKRRGAQGIWTVALLGGGVGGGEASLRAG